MQSYRGSRYGIYEAQETCGKRIWQTTEDDCNVIIRSSNGKQKEEIIEFGSGNARGRGGAREKLQNLSRTHRGVNFPTRVFQFGLCFFKTKARLSSAVRPFLLSPPPPSSPAERKYLVIKRKNTSTKGADIRGRSYNPGTLYSPPAPIRFIAESVSRLLMPFPDNAVRLPRRPYSALSVTNKSGAKRGNLYESYARFNAFSPGPT